MYECNRAAQRVCFMTMVSVTFVDAGSGVPIGHGEMPSETLPETLDIAGSHYSVERAESPAPGELTLFLRPIETMSPHDILFSLPTVCDRVPEADPVLVSAVMFEMHEDDWRQIEFVDASLAPVVEEQRRWLTASNVVWRGDEDASSPAVLGPPEPDELYE